MPDDPARPLHWHGPWPCDDPQCNLAPDGYQYGVRFNDGSIRDSWNGRTQRERAIAELVRLRAEYPRDDMALVRRAGRAAPWMVVDGE